MPREFLLFRLSGPLASWGEIAVGERRSSWPRPSKSAVLGLVAAGLGYRPARRERSCALNDGLNFAVRVDTPMLGFTTGSGCRFWFEAAPGLPHSPSSLGTTRKEVDATSRRTPRGSTEYNSVRTMVLDQYDGNGRPVVERGGR